jgi:hypothetical protein
MIKKIITIVLVSVILVTGYISFQKLNFWERSVMIFKISPSARQFEGMRGGRFRMEEGREGFAARQQPRQNTQNAGRMNIPDSLRGRRNFRPQNNEGRIRNMNDTLRAGRGDRRPENFTRESAAGGVRRMEDFEGREGRGGRNGRGGSTIELRNVIYFLGVFALFTMITIYIEKCYRIIFKSKKLSKEKSDLII